MLLAKERSINGIKALFMTTVINTDHSVDRIYEIYYGIGEPDKLTERQGITLVLKEAIDIFNTLM